MLNRTEHTPLFLSTISSLLSERRASKVVDATFAEGGHGLSLAGLGLMVLGIEADEQMYAVGQANIKASKLDQIKLLKGNYRDLKKMVNKQHFAPVDAVIMDLGLSMYQLNHSQKGFSLKREAILDLRLSSTQPQTAAAFLQQASKNEIMEVLTRYIESPYSQALAYKLMAFRHKKPVQTVLDLEQIISQLNLDKVKSQNLMRQTLQALRMVVNHEFEAIKQAISQAWEILAEKGLLFVLTYHSLEDRLVKQYVRQNLPGFLPLGKASKNRDYQFAKSGKLRIYEKNDLK